ncbi:HNH endonuclease [Peptoniphilus stercorisuis]|uniref:HNH nuclease domain-containing protein n=1 Tax=Peptoniphilus stercorisuis TaxID=1436965 RepID=A0ABS4KBE4_9FIRM|nr:HNH endonuclease signature motif containing protein [Peptoniphilus stercorisuis]MBP2025082.1 hypothetical protein [Peptoniphilus stercorisuis]
MRKNIKTTKKEIVNYWFNKIDESNLSVDFTEAHERCWRCGYKVPLERCHIIPDSLGGEDSPENLVLLCKRCHIENPNGFDKDIMWDWIFAYKTSLYDTFWIDRGIEEYNRIYSVSIEEEIKQRKIYDEQKFKNLIEEEIKKTTYHFGHPYLNAATIAGVLRISINKYNKDIYIK